MKRLRLADLAMGLCGAALLVALFLPWTSPASAWETLGVLDIYLAVIAVGGLLVVALTLFTPTPAQPLSAAAITTTFSLIAVIWVLLKLLGTSPRAGGFLALGACVGLFATGIWVMRDESMPGHPHQREPELLDTPAP